MLLLLPPGFCTSPSAQMVSHATVPSHRTMLLWRGRLVRHVALRMLVEHLRVHAILLLCKGVVLWLLGKGMVLWLLCKGIVRHLVVVPIPIVPLALPWRGGPARVLWRWTWHLLQTNCAVVLNGALNWKAFFWHANRRRSSRRMHAGQWRRSSRLDAR